MGQVGLRRGLLQVSSGGVAQRLHPLRLGHRGKRRGCGKQDCSEGCGGGEQGGRGAARGTPHGAGGRRCRNAGRNQRRDRHRGNLPVPVDQRVNCPGRCRGEQGEARRPLYPTRVTEPPHPRRPEQAEAAEPQQPSDQPGVGEELERNAVGRAHRGVIAAVEVADDRERARPPAAERLVAERSRRLLPPDPAIGPVGGDQPAWVVPGPGLGLLEGVDLVRDRADQAAARDGEHSGDRDREHQDPRGQQPPDAASPLRRPANGGLEAQQLAAGDSGGGEAEQQDEAENRPLAGPLVDRESTCGEVMETEGESDRGHRDGHSGDSGGEPAQPLRPGSDHHRQHRQIGEQRSARVGACGRQHEHDQGQHRPDPHPRRPVRRGGQPDADRGRHHAEDPDRVPVSDRLADPGELVPGVEVEEGKVKPGNDLAAERIERHHQRRRGEPDRDPARRGARVRGRDHRDRGDHRVGDRPVGGQPGLVRRRRPEHRERAPQREAAEQRHPGPDQCDARRSQGPGGEAEAAGHADPGDADLEPALLRDRGGAVAERGVEAGDDQDHQQPAPEAEIRDGVACAPQPVSPGESHRFHRAQSS